jgi:hypothetical protein
LQQLKNTQADVTKELDSTTRTLDETVHKAEAEIHDQVDSMKADFEQYVLHTEDQFSMENSFMVYQLAGTFTLLSCLISMWHMGSHMRKMNQPAVSYPREFNLLSSLDSMLNRCISISHQIDPTKNFGHSVDVSYLCKTGQELVLVGTIRHVGILILSLFFRPQATTSWLSLVFPSSAGYLAIVKDGYEAYIIYQFLSFCISVLGKGDRNKVVDLLSKQVDHLTPPFRLFPCCCKPHYEDDRALADAILTQCQAFTMQFVFWRPVTTIANFLLNKYQYYGLSDNPHDYRAPQFYVTLIQNLSIFIAFAGLLKFYHAVDKDLEWCRPFAKFLCIKGVVFMTFWQGLALSVLAETTDVGGGGNSDQWAESAQNFLICLEMLLFSIAHFYCFPVEEWQPGYEANYQKAKFGETMALNDFFTDLKLVMSSNYGSKAKKKKQSWSSSEHTVLEEQDGELRDEEGGQGYATLKSSAEEESSGDDAEISKQALVKAIVDSVRSLEDADERLSAPENDVTVAQERIGAMLDAMLFHSPRNLESNKEQENTSGDFRTDVENVLDDPSANAEGSFNETSSILPREILPSMDPSLRPSIFTTIAAHMDKEKAMQPELVNESDKVPQDEEWTNV